jgi:hypothetical protein
VKCMQYRPLSCSFSSGPRADTPARNENPLSTEMERGQGDGVRFAD